MVMEPTERAWGFSQGEEIVPGRYALDLLGGGRRYEVYLAWDERLRTAVAVKLLRPDRVSAEGAIGGFRAEAAALRQLQHPVLPRCFGVDLALPRPHVALEYLEGPRLSTLLRRHGPLAVEQALPLGLQLCAALHYMHGEGMVHLDVKPKNVIMGAPPRLIDLSIAMPIGRAREHRGAIGTDAYMAPEQCGVPGRGEMGPGSDVWGLGVTLYEAMTGRSPFPSSAGRESSPAARFPQLVTPPAPLPREFPPVLADPILACLVADPERRPTASQLADALEQLVDALPRRPVVSQRRPRVRR
jgi:eukaryotic-like serine/threonine-protein kinase